MIMQPFLNSVQQSKHHQVEHDHANFVNSVQQSLSNQEKWVHYQLIINSVLQPKHGEGERVQYVANSVPNVSSE